jgi:hypothetical protein
MPKLRYSEADAGVTDGYVQLLHGVLDTCQLHHEPLIQLYPNRMTDLCSILLSFGSASERCYAHWSCNILRETCCGFSTGSILSRFSYTVYMPLESYSRFCSPLQPQRYPLHRYQTSRNTSFVTCWSQVRCLTQVFKVFQDDWSLDRGPRPCNLSRFLVTECDLRNMWESLEDATSRDSPSLPLYVACWRTNVSNLGGWK